MLKNLDPANIHQLIVNDFEGAWDSVASNPSQIGRGNFMFARQAMNLLEFASILCHADTTGKALVTLSDELQKIDPKYFTTLPAPCGLTTDFTLPNNGNVSGNLLLWALFDLVRNGLAHQYQQIIVSLNDGKLFGILLTGAESGRILAKVQSSAQPSGHLSYTFDKDGDLVLRVYSEILFLDIKLAISRSGILGKGLSFVHMVRPKGKSLKYNFDTKSLESNLSSAGHLKM